MVEDEGQPQPRAPETAPPIIAALANASTAANANGKPVSAARGQATAKSAGGMPTANAAAGAANDAAPLNTAQPAQASPVRDAALMVASQHLAPGQAAGEQAQPDAAAFREALSSALPEQANPAGGLDGLRPGNAASAVPILARSAAQAPLPFAEQIAFNIRQAIDSGETQIRIQLQPQELGRVDVRLEMTEAGKVTALISAERQDTLDLLMKDSRSLEKALQEAGLDVDSNSLAFDLEQGNEDPESASQGDSGDLADLAQNVTETDVVMPAAAILSGAPGGVDISV
jgi:flagellar hook-length control protein FliK